MTTATRSKTPTLLFATGQLFSCFAAAGLVLTLAWPADAQSGTGTVRVSPSGSDVNGCGSVATPCLTVQRAIDLATTGDLIKVATGTYSSTTTCLGRSVVACIVNRQVTIVGGFPTGDWTTPTPAATPTVLDGLDSHRVIMVQDTSSAPPDTASLTLSGVTITRGFVQGEASGNDTAITAFGGGLDAVNAPVHLTGVVVSNNRALGGGTVSSEPDDHGGTGAGGGISLRGLTGNTQVSTFHNVTFDSNVAEGGARSDGGARRGGLAQGGGLFVFRTRLDAFQVTFTNNRAQAGDAPSSTGAAGSGLRADALGAGACVEVDGNVTFEGVVASGNLAIGGDARTSSGGLAGGGFGSAIFGELGTLTIRDANLTGNMSQGGAAESGGLGAGGAVMTTGTILTIDRAFVIDNLAKGGNGSGPAGAGGGGGIYLSGNTSLALSNLVVADNAAERGNLGSAVGGGGGGLFLQTSTGSVVHATLAGNRIDANMQGGAAVLLGGASVAFDYTIFANYTGTVPALHVQPGNTATLDRGIFSGNSFDTNADGTGGSPGTINGLGTMLDFASLDFVSPGSPSFDYHLLETSPAIDAATGSTTTLDVDGDVRANPDIGADEFGSIFSDGFESGNTSRWSASVP